MTTFRKIIMLLCLTYIVTNISTSYCNEAEEIFIKHGPRDQKKIAITFDDGPHPKETDQVLDTLKKYNVKATFFIAGKHANWYSEPLIRANKEGHEIGNHTFNHPDISDLNQKQIENEILKCEEVLQEKINKKTNLFRPPYGNYNKAVIEDVANKLDYKIVLWTTLDTKDWKNPSAQAIANKIINNAQNGDIILLHDYGTQNTVEALDIFIPKMKESGYEFVTVSELIQDKEDVTEFIYD